MMPAVPGAMRRTWRAGRDRPGRTMNVRLTTLVAAAALAACAGCARTPNATRWADVIEVTPAFLSPVKAFDPALAAAAGGRVALTWVTRDSGGADAWIAFSADSGAHFSAPVRLNLRRSHVSSYPESRPVAAFGANGSVVAAWAASRDTGEAADDIVARASDDGGASFGPEVVLNDDHALAGSTYHGFIALDATPQGRFHAAWIDGRSIALGPGEVEPAIAEIWSAASDDGGATWGANVRAAANVCPCCRPSLRVSASLLALSYRGEQDSLRDPRLALSRDGGMTFALDTLVSADGWSLAGCPSTGPALTLARDGGQVAWYTGAAGRKGVYARAWRAGLGASGPVVALDDSLRDAGQPLLAAMGPVTLVGVVASAEPSRRVLALRTLGPSGARSSWLPLGADASSAAIAAQDARHALAAWIESSDAGPRLRLVRVTRR